MKWVASTTELSDAGDLGSPAFPYDLYRRISKKSDVLEALGSDCQEMQNDLGSNGFEALVQALWEINQCPHLFTSHSVTSVDCGKTVPELYDWATYRVMCRVCILPCDTEVPDLETARTIVNQVHVFRLNQVRARGSKPPRDTLVFCEPILMRFGLRTQSFPTLGFAVRVRVEGYAGREKEAGARCARALAFLAELLAQARC